MTNVEKDEKPREIVKEIVTRYIQAKPRRISLKLYWEDKRSSISVRGENLNETIEHPQTIDFTSFAEGVLEAYKEAYGELEVVPISFREEIYRNDKVSLDLYPTGSEGIFDIFVEYKDKGRCFSQL
jgi:hemoglobin-like flavoprotein